MSTLIVTVSAAGLFDEEALETIREDCEDVVRAMGGHGVTVELEVLK